MFLYLLFRKKKGYKYILLPKLEDGFNTVDIFIENTLYYFNDKRVFSKKAFNLETDLKEQTLNYKLPIDEQEEKALKKLLDGFIGYKLNIIHSFKAKPFFYSKNSLSLIEPAIRSLELMKMSIYFKPALEYNIRDLLTHIVLFLDYEKYFINIFGLGGENKNKDGWSVIEYYRVQPSDYFKIIQKFKLTEFNGELHMPLNKLDLNGIRYLEDILEVKFHRTQLSATNIRIKHDIEKIVDITEA